MARATIDVDPSLVRWARESAGLSVQAAAKKVGVKAGKFELWETAGVPDRPTATQLERLADAVKRPVATFFLPEPPAEPPLPADFRKPPTAKPPAALSYAARLAIRRAQRLQAIFADLSVDAGEKVPRIEVSRKRPAAEAARAAREILGISTERQAKWRDAEVALKEWRSRLEELGLLVFQLAMPKEEVNGFSLSDTAPAIVVNKKDHHSRRCFTLFHEWAHLLLGEPGLCFVEEGRAEGTDESVEVYCNAFAGSLLVPMDALRRLDALSPDLRGSLEEAVEEGVRRFAVSRYVILRRLLTGNIINQESYRRLAAKWDRARQEQEKKPRAKQKGGPAPHVKTVSELGPGFVSRVLRAHERGLVSDLEIADYFALKLRHLEKVEALVGRVYL